MDGFDSTFNWDNIGGWEQIPSELSNINEIDGSNTNNVIPIEEDEASDSFMADEELDNDSAQKRRAANRQYSETYRRKKQDHVQNLENLEKSLNASISDNNPQLGYQQGLESQYAAEESSLSQKLNSLTSNYQCLEADIDMYASELEEQKLMHEVYETLQPEMQKYQG